MVFYIATMSNSGPGLAVDDQGRAVVAGFIITGNEVDGYQATIAVDLTADEVHGGCVHVITNRFLGYLLQEVAAQRDLRSQL
jgi:hypothetical protein